MPKKKNATPKSNKKEVIENISIVAEKIGTKINEPIEKYGNSIANNLGLIIKAISFVTAFAIILIAFAIAFLVFSTQPLYIALSLGIVVVGTILAAIIMFLIYGLGHLIIQNNEIIKRLKDLEK